MKKSVFLYRALVDRKNNICKKMSRRTAILLSAMLLLSLITGCENAGRDAADPAGGPGNEAAQSAGTASAEDRSRSASEAAVSKSGGAQEAGTAAASQSEIDIPEKPYHRDDGGVSMDVFAMDTYMTLLAYGDKAEEAVLAAAEEIHSLDALLSTGSAESEVSKLNAAGGGEVSPVVQELIERSQQLYTETGGLFDIAIYPIMKLWGFPTQDYHVPDQTELEAALKLADPTAITLEPVAEPAAPASAGPGETAPVQTPAAETPAAETPAAESPETEAPAAEAPDDNGEAAPAGSTAAGSAGPVAAPAQEAPAQEAPAQETPASETPTSRTYVRAAFGIPGMEIDLGGIAKGYTSARVMEIFREHGIEHGLVSLGGNVQTVGPKEGGDPWRIAIQDPESELEYLGVLKIEDKCVITSGGYERFFDEGGKRYHHIIDPRTGYPADSGIISATIISEDGALADGLSTSLFIMGKDEAEKYWQAHSDTFDYILEDTGGTLYVTEGAEKILTTEKKTVVIKRK